MICRSLRMPSTTRSAGASGWRRRVASYRFTRSSSEASRNTIRYSMLERLELLERLRQLAEEHAPARVDHDRDACRAARARS